MVSRLKEVNPVWADLINQPVLLGDSPRPATRQLKPQRLRLADADKGISQNRLDQIKSSQGSLAVDLHPVPEVPAKLRVEYRLAITGQAPSPGATCQRFPV